MLALHIESLTHRNLLAAAAHTAEVSGLKQNLERAKKELGLMKKQLEDSKGM